MQRRVLDWGGRLSRCFGRVVKTLHYGKVSPIVRATHYQHHSLSINRTHLTVQLRKTPLPTFRNELAGLASSTPSRSFYTPVPPMATKRTNSASLRCSPRQMRPLKRRPTAELNSTRRSCLPTERCP